MTNIKKTYIPFDTEYPAPLVMDVEEKLLDEIFLKLEGVIKGFLDSYVAIEESRKNSFRVAIHRERPTLKYALFSPY